MSTAVTSSPGDLRVWWIPQIPGNAFRVPVASPVEAKKILDVLAQYDLFQLANNIKPDYCNVGGLECYQQHGAPEPEDDFPDWCEWESEDGYGIDEYGVMG
jgi:hypothetical protein